MVAWNKGKRVGQKKAFKLEDIWRIRIRLELEERLFELALFNLAIDSKLRACDLRNLKVLDVSRSGCVMSRAIVKQQKTHQEVHFEITPKTQQTLSQWIILNGLTPTDYVFQAHVVKVSQFLTITTRPWLTDG